MKITKIMFFGFLVTNFVGINAAQGQLSNLLSSKVNNIIQSRYASNPMMHAHNPSAFKKDMQIVRQIQAVEKRIAADVANHNDKNLVDAMTDIIAVKSIKESMQYLGSSQYVADLKLKNLAQEVESQALAMIPIVEKAKQEAVRAGSVFTFSGVQSAFTRCSQKSE